MKILLEEFHEKVGRENIFKLTIWNENVHQDSNDNDVRIVNFATSKNLVVERTMFLHQNLHKYTWTSPDGKTHNQIYLFIFISIQPVIHVTSHTSKYNIVQHTVLSH